MKIALAVNEKNINEGVSPSFGRAYFFAIYDSQSKETNFIDNPGASSPGGAGIKAGQAVVDSGAKVLITPRLGENAADVLQAAGVKIYKSAAGSVQDNIQAYEEGQLASLDEFHAGFHTGGQ